MQCFLYVNFIVAVRNGKISSATLFFFCQNVRFLPSLLLNEQLAGRFGC